MISTMDKCTIYVPRFLGIPRKRSLQKVQGICAFCGMITKTVEITNACRLTARHPRSMGSTTELQ